MKYFLFLSSSILLFLFISSSTCATITFDNTTIGCGDLSSPCLLSDPLIWKERVVPGPQDEAYISSSDELYFALGTNTTLVIQSLYLVSKGALIIDGGFLFVGVNSSYAQVTAQVSSNVTIKASGAFISSGTLYFKGVSLQVSDYGRVEVGLFTDNAERDAIKYLGSSNSIVVGGSGEVFANLRLYSTSISLHNQARLTLPLTDDGIAVVADLHVSDQVVFTVGQKRLVVNGQTVYASHNKLLVESLIVNGSALIYADVTVDETLTFFPGAQLVIDGNYIGNQGLKLENGFSNGFANFIINNGTAHIGAKLDPRQPYVDVVEKIRLEVSNGNLFIGNEAWRDYIVDATTSSITAVNSSVSGFFGIYNLTLDEKSLFISGNVVLKADLITKAHLNLPWYGLLTVDSGVKVSFSGCQWWPWTFLTIKGSLTCYDVTTSDPSISVTLNEGLLDIVGGKSIQIASLSVSKNSQILCDDVQVNNLQFLTPNDTTLYIAGDLTVRQNVTIPSFSTLRQPLIKTNSSLYVSGSTVHVNGSQLKMKPGEDLKYTIVEADISVEGTFLELLAVDFKNIRAYVEYDTNTLVLEFTEKTAKKWKFPKYGYGVVAVVVILFVLIAAAIVRHNYMKRKNGDYLPLVDK